MDKIKATSSQFNRVNPSQSGAKERDEGFVSSRADVSKAKSQVAATKSADAQAAKATDLVDNRSNILVEQRKQALAKQISEKEKAREQQEKQEELSAQRQLEARAAANKQKIKSSYHAVQTNNNQPKPDDINSGQSAAQSTNQSSADSSKPSGPDPINLVV